MADDTRQNSTAVPPPSIQDTITPPPRPKGPANTMPGGTAHTAGGTPADYSPSYLEVVKSLGPEYYLNFYKRPCVRDSQLMGLGALFVGMGFAAIIRKTPRIMSNYGVISWLVVSCSSYQYCQYQRSQEITGMRMAKEIMEQKRADFEAKREARRKAKEERERREEEARLEAEKKTWGYWLKKNAKFW